MKKVLIISSTFYPDKKVAAIRVSQWAKHLPEFGWKPIVACRYYGSDASTEDIHKHLNEHVEIHYLDRSADDSKKKRSTGFVQKAKSMVARSLADVVSVPDMSIWSWRRLQPKLNELVRLTKPDVVLTSSPPHSIHEVGMKIQENSGIPWVADFRDPYLMDLRFRPAGLKKFRISAFQHFDDQVAQRAAAILYAIRAHYEAAIALYPKGKKQFLPNGFPSDMPLSCPHDSEKTTLVTAGVISEESVQFVQSLMAELEKIGIDAEFFQYGAKPKSAGSLDSHSSQRVHFCGPVPHRTAIEKIAGARILFLFSSSERAASMGLSSKLFEYLATGKPIVIIRPTEPDRQLVSNLPWVLTLSEPDRFAVAEFIQTAKIEGIAADKKWLVDFRNQFNRRAQTDVLADCLNQVLSERERKNCI